MGYAAPADTGKTINIYLEIMSQNISLSWNFLSYMNTTATSVSVKIAAANSLTSVSYIRGTGLTLWRQ